MAKISCKYFVNVLGAAKKESDKFWFGLIVGGG